MAALPPVTYDVLDGPGRDVPRRAPRLLLVAVLVLAALGWGADRWVRSHELDRLAGAATASEAVVQASARSLTSLEQYQAPALAGADVPPGLRASLLGNLGRDAGRWTSQLDDQRRAVAAVEVLPWHRDVRRARAAYLGRITGWARFLVQVHADPVQLLRTRPELRAEQEGAAVAFDAVADGRRDLTRLAAGLRGQG